MTMINLENLTTERRNQATFGLDEMTVAEACQKMNAEDQKVAQSVEKELPSIEKVIQQTIQSFKKGTIDLSRCWYQRTTRSFRCR